MYSSYIIHFAGPEEKLEKSDHEVAVAVSRIYCDSLMNHPQYKNLPQNIRDSISQIRNSCPEHYSQATVCRENHE